MVVVVELWLNSCQYLGMFTFHMFGELRSVFLLVFCSVQTDGHHADRAWVSTNKSTMMPPLGAGFVLKEDGGVVFCCTVPTNDKSSKL